MRTLNIQLQLEFSMDGFGGPDLLQMCKHYARTRHPKPMIFLFDRDDERILRVLGSMDTQGRGYQEWNNNVYSLFLPIPPGRKEVAHSICIEFFYSDQDITRVDGAGRRLFVNTEFDPRTGADSTRKLICRDRNLLNKGTASIVDHDVLELDTGKSVALSKDDFATAILNRLAPFDKVDHVAFRSIFDVVEAIVRQGKNPNR